MDLETNVAELDAFGFTVIEGAASPELVERLQTAICSEIERQTGTKPDVVNGKATIQGMRYRGA
jgi:hypothetical protein